ncbi:carbon storage regulator CsrA [Melghiribacillus thermohalophilus]|uniref:Translational regulator CsrA n=1 Tax=Melghiribacillus thermohalophilus TaxID=1324956 RepID=A0A4R3MV98_9BACI|nr:carbon storage regulator CsrA [Melghiribacillus thermohalophilus]TCT20448.1 carbon storage regulator CsrA [Melghiribacillus thermohalophilus]
MLVLTRKVNESVQIGDDIEVKVVGIDGEQIKLGISAPKDVDIHRLEIYEQIQEENRKASQGTKNAIDLLKNAKKD